MNRQPTPERLLTAIHAFCMECSGGSRKLVEGCDRGNCPLHPYRSRRAAGAPPQQAKEIAGQMTMRELLAGGA